VADFEAYLQTCLGPRLGAQTNFGVIDGEGHAFLYEVHNHGFQKFDAAGGEHGLLVNTNYARSGAPGKGAGYLRFERASELIGGLGSVTPQALLAKVARDTGNPLTRQPSVLTLDPLPKAAQELWVATKDSINKSYTAATVVLVGRRPGQVGSHATFWILPGEPVTGVAIPLWVEAGRAPEALWSGEDAPLWLETLRIKKLGRPFADKERHEYLNLSRLANADGTGYLPGLQALEKEIFAATAGFAPETRTPAELGAFQDAMAAKALMGLKAVGK
jgi:hypothetical protein